MGESGPYISLSSEKSKKNHVAKDGSSLDIQKLLCSQVSRFSPKMHYQLAT